MSIFQEPGVFSARKPAQVNSGNDEVTFRSVESQQDIIISPNYVTVLFCMLIVKIVNSANIPEHEGV